MVRSEFEQRYLLCDLDMALIPGPREFEEPFYSIAIYESEDYLAEDVARTFSALDSVRVVERGVAEHVEDWYRWKWRWEQGDRTIELGFSIFDPEAPGDPVYWGGSPLLALATYADVVRLWHGVQAHHPAVWLHSDDCRVYTPHSFLSELAIPRLQPALEHEDPGVQALAWQELDVYRHLGYRDDDER